MIWVGQTLGMVRGGRGRAGQGAPPSGAWGGESPPHDPVTSCSANEIGPRDFLPLECLQTDTEGHVG